MKRTRSSERMLTKADHVRLRRLAAQLQPAASQAVRPLLERSYLVPSPAIPASVITMHTQVLLQDDFRGESSRITLCYPADAEPARGFVSVLSPMGGSLVGAAGGDVVRWRTVGGEHRASRVVEVLFQPEAQGDYVR